MPTFHTGAWIMLATVACGCSNNTQKHLAEDSKAFHEAHPSLDSIAAATCVPSLWNRVYLPRRLKVIERCKTVIGTIEETHPDADGDQHMLLRPDSGQEELINSVNKRRKNGCLVIEAVCVNSVKQPKVGNTCAGFANPILLPAVGDHVQVTGSYVLDLDNGWNEIHPIMKLVIL